MKLSQWSKAVKIALIEKDMRVADLAKAVGLSREYTNAVVNERVISPPARKSISDYLNIADIDE